MTTHNTPETIGYDPLADDSAKGGVRTRRTRWHDIETPDWGRELFVDGPVAVLVWRLESRWPVCHASPNVERIFGYPSESMRREEFHYLSVIHPEDVDRVAGEVVRALNEGCDTWEQHYRIIRADGQVRRLYDFTVVDRDALGRPYRLRGYVIDETEMLQHEQAFRTLAEAITEAVWISASDTRLLYANPAALCLTGQDDAGLGDRRWVDLIAPLSQEDFSRLLEAKAPAHGEVWMLGPDLSEVRVDLRLRPLEDGGCLAIGRRIEQPVPRETLPHPKHRGGVPSFPRTHPQVTLDHTTLDGLYETWQIHRAILDQAADSIVLIDARTLRFVEFNEVACRSLGYSRTEFARLGIPDIQADLSPRGIAYWRGLINSSGQGDFDTCHRHKNGEIRHVRVSNRLLNIRDGLYWVAIWHDITEQRRLKAELDEHRRHLEGLVRRRTADLERARLEADSLNLARSVLLANMSHEVRDPINTIMALTQALTDGISDPDQRQRLTQIRDAADQLLRVANDILDLARTESGQLHLDCVDFELRPSLARLQLLLDPEIQAKGLRWRLVMDPTLPDRLQGDPARLGQVLLHLVSHGIKFSDQGTITLRVNVLERTDDRIRICFEVHTQGFGPTEPPATTRLRASQPHAMSSTSRLGGVDLGLVISRRLIEQMHGELGVDGRVGGPVWFTAWFGVVPAPE